jgi:hypothetical protein
MAWSDRHRAMLAEMGLRLWPPPAGADDLPAVGPVARAPIVAPTTAPVAAPTTAPVPAAATVTSQASASSNAPPMQKPWTDAIVGLGQSQKAMMKSKSASSTLRHPPNRATYVSAEYFDNGDMTSRMRG